MKKHFRQTLHSVIQIIHCIVGLKCFCLHFVCSWKLF